MKKAIVIGGRGKTGQYLVPMLAESGYEVYSVSRSARAPVVQHACWKDVHQVSIDREADAAFERTIADIGADVVVDMICFSKDKMTRLTDLLKGQTGHYIAAGSVWVHGTPTFAPVQEWMSRNPTGDYGIQKDAMSYELKRLWTQEKFPGTIVHPGHICAPGDFPVTPQGNKDKSVVAKMMRGERVVLPNNGMETLHHVHAEDVAGVIFAAVNAGSVSFGQDFHAVSGPTCTMVGYAQAAFGWFGQAANIGFMPLDELVRALPQPHARLTLEHTLRSPNASMDNAKRLLGFVPKHIGMYAAKEAMMWFVDRGLIEG